MNFLATLVATVLLIAAQRWGLPLWGALLLLWGYYHFMLYPQTWMEYLAAMNVRRLEGKPDRPAGTVILPPDPAELCNEPDAMFIVERLLYPGAAFDNFLAAQYAAIFYFHVVPIPWKDRGLTFLLNRLEVRPDATGDKARRLKKRWLNRYAPEGFHK